MTPGLLFEYCFCVVTGIGAGLLVIGIPLSVLATTTDKTLKEREKDE